MWEASLRCWGFPRWWPEISQAMLQVFLLQQEAGAQHGVVPQGHTYPRHILGERCQTFNSLLSHQDGLYCRTCHLKVEPKESPKIFANTSVIKPQDGKVRLSPGKCQRESSKIIKLLQLARGPKIQLSDDCWQNLGVICTNILTLWLPGSTSNLEKIGWNSLVRDNLNLRIWNWLIIAAFYDPNCNFIIRIFLFYPSYILRILKLVQEKFYNLNLNIFKFDNIRPSQAETD